MALLISSEACATYEPNNPAYYCDDIVLWPVATDIQENAWTYTKKAFSLYHDLKTRYLEGSANSPSLSCLAVAREFYCAYSFPYCADDINESKRGVCSFLCQIWKDRCPNEDYETFCANSVGTQCSFSEFLIITMAVGLLLV